MALERSDRGVDLLVSRQGRGVDEGLRADVAQEVLLVRKLVMKSSAIVEDGFSGPVNNDATWGIAQGQHSCFSYSGPGFGSRYSQKFILRYW